MSGSGSSPSPRRTANTSSRRRSLCKTAKPILGPYGSPACRASSGNEAGSSPAQVGAKAGTVSFGHGHRAPNSLRRFRLLREYLRRLGAGEHAIITLHLGDAYAVVGEDLVAAARLRNMMLGLPAPRDHRRLIAPERERDVFPLSGQAAEALDRNETIDGLEKRTQAGGDIEISLQATGLGLYFEDDGEHG